MKRLVGAVLSFPLILGLRWIDRRFMQAAASLPDVDDTEVDELRAELADPKKVAAWLGASS